MEIFTIYLATTPALRDKRIVKIGCTKNPRHRRSTYLTGCAPGRAPSQDIDYEAIWETRAASEVDLYHLEAEVHDRFRSLRLQRARPGDSEWFDFRDEDPLAAVDGYIRARPWFLRPVALGEIAPRPAGRHMNLAYRKNFLLVRTRAARNAALDAAQGPVIASIVRHLADAAAPAGCVVAPCGSGKTKMAARALALARNSRRPRIMWAS